MQVLTVERQALSVRGVMGSRRVGRKRQCKASMLSVQLHMLRLLAGVSVFA